MFWNWKSDIFAVIGQLCTGWKIVSVVRTSFSSSFLRSWQKHFSHIKCEHWHATGETVQKYVETTKWLPLCDGWLVFQYRYVIQTLYKPQGCKLVMTQKSEHGYLPDNYKCTVPILFPWCTLHTKWHISLWMIFRLTIWSSVNKH